MPALAQIISLTKVFGQEQRQIVSFLSDDFRNQVAVCQRKLSDILNSIYCADWASDISKIIFYCVDESCQTNKFYNSAPPLLRRLVTTHELKYAGPVTYQCFHRLCGGERW